jgi:transcriptional regulator with XRE-family HTH domain
LLAKKQAISVHAGVLAAPKFTPKFDFSVLRRLREQHELTLAELSKASGVSGPVISKLERNQQSAELDTLYRLARAFGLSTTDLLALAESPLAHRAAEKPHRSGEFKFRQLKYANVVALLGSAPRGARVSRPEIHHDDTEVCWVTDGKLRLKLPHQECILEAGESIQFDAIQQHTYEALADSNFIILHLRKDKRY